MRKYLKYPTNRKFLEYVNSQYEWFILTDLRLNPLVAIRGETGKIPPKVELNAYNQLHDKVPEGRVVEIYVMHTHPSSSRSVPSFADFGSLIEDKYFEQHHQRIKVKGYGIISHDNIFITDIKFRGSLNDLLELKEPLKEQLKEGTFDRIATRVGLTKGEEINKELRRLEDSDAKRAERIELDSQGRSFKALAKETGYIKHKTIPRHTKYSRR
jgi:hypothetical protein